MNTHAPFTMDTSDFSPNIGIITTTVTELAVAQAVFDFAGPYSTHNGTQYWSSVIDDPTGNYHVLALVKCIGMGSIASVTACAHLLEAFPSITDVMLIGIAGGIPNPDKVARHIRLGDIVASDFRGIYDETLTISQNQDSTKSQPQPIQVPASYNLSQAVQTLQSGMEDSQYPWEQLMDCHPNWQRPAEDQDILDDGEGPVQHPTDTTRRPGRPKLFVGKIVSSDRIVSNVQLRKSYKKRNVFAVDVEGAGVARFTHSKRKGYLIVRGISDYCNHDSRTRKDIWRGYAALAATAFARSILEATPGSSQYNQASSSRQSLQPFQRSWSVDISVTGISIKYNERSASQTISVPVSGFDLGSLPTSPTSLLEIIPYWLKQVFSRLLSSSSSKKATEKLVSHMDAFRDQIGVWNYVQAFALGHDIEQMMSSSSSVLADDKLCDAFILLARAEINKVETRLAEDCDTSLKKAAVFLEKAKHYAVRCKTSCESDIVALEAILLSYTDKPEAGLRKLATLNDPVSVRTRLVLMLNTGQHMAGCQLVKSLPPHERWAELAVKACATAGEFDAAQKIVVWAKTQYDKRIFYRSSIKLASVLFDRALVSSKDGDPVRPWAVGSEESERLTQIVNVLEPVVATVRELSSVDNELFSSGIRLALQCNFLLGNRDECEFLLTVLCTRTPVPLEVVRGAISGYFTPPADLAARVRMQHASDFEACVLATVLQTVCFQKHEEAYLEALQLVDKAQSNDQKEDLSTLFQQIGQEMDQATFAKYEQQYVKVAESLIQHNSRLRSMFKAGQYLRKQKPDLALPLIEETKDELDLYWLQLKAATLQALGDDKGAVSFLVKACELSPATNLMHQAAMVALKSGLTDVGQEMYEKILRLDPEDLVATHNLANIFLSQGDYATAAQYFRKLADLDPDNPAYGINLAACLVQSGDLDGSLEIYDQLLISETDLRVIVSKAQVLKTLGRFAGAFQAMEVFRPRLWDNPSFTTSYMSFAYAAGKDDKAHEAMIQIMALKQAGKVPDEVIRSITADEGFDLLKETLTDQEDRNQKIHTEMLKGRMPWLWAEDMMHNASTWGWFRRTQGMSWIGDDPTNRAMFAIYATNGFHATLGPHDRKELLPLSCPGGGERVVADLSALITLDRLGLLDRALDYFDGFVIPVSYFGHLLQDSDRLALIQPSRQKTAGLINSAVQDRRITVLVDPSALGTPLALVDEYNTSGDLHLYRLCDVLASLLQSGQLGRSQYDKISAVAAQSSAVDSEHPPLKPLDAILVDLTTLEVLVDFGLLGALTDHFSVHIFEKTHQTVLGTLKSFDLREDVHARHIALWEKLRNDKRFRPVPHSERSQPESAKDDDREYPVAFHASFVAQEMRLPLLADDRVCQAFTLNERQVESNAAFGTDVLITALANADLLTEAQSADMYLQLIRWRYRFIVPTSGILHTWAIEYVGNPPGQALREVACYVHDCFRDTGLFGGPEQTNPPVSMAMRLYLSWLRVIAEFLMQIWDDDAFSEDKAKELTDWCVRELLPSLPRFVHGSVKVRLADMTAQYLLSHALINPNSLAHGERVPDAMKALKDALKLSDDEYLRIMTGILSDTGRKDPKP